jgi:tRNA(His) guanylyltransferase
MQVPGEEVKKREIYSDIRALAPVIIRLDGRAFHQLAEEMHLKKPFDDHFSTIMAGVCEYCIRDSGLSPVFAYTFSDEISLFIPVLPFNGRIEKLDAIPASYAASVFTILAQIKRPVSFDARVIPVTMDHVLPYLIWRQNEAWRNHINAYCQQALIEEGYSASDAASMLFKMPVSQLHELMFQRGINLSQTPAWQRRGILVSRIITQKPGYNKKTNKETIATRRTIHINRELPIFSSPEGEKFFMQLFT